MRQVFIARYPGEAYLVRTVLKSEGIAGILHGYALGTQDREHFRPSGLLKTHK